MNASRQQNDPGTMSASERAAMKERAAELRTEAKHGRGAAKAAQQAQDVRDRIAEMPDADRVLAEKVHALVAQEAPVLAPAALDEGTMWATAYALTAIGADEEQRIRVLVRRASAATPAAAESPAESQAESPAAD